MRLLRLWLGQLWRVWDEECQGRNGQALGLDGSEVCWVQGSGESHAWMSWSGFEELLRMDAYIHLGA